MGTSAQTILNNTFTLLGTKAAGETVSADLMVDGLGRLNRMVAWLRTQSLIPTSIDRDVFALTANRQTYTIGPGGDFNVPRPQSNTINGAAILLNGLGAARSGTITRVANVATVALSTHGFSVGENVLIAGANEIDYNGPITVTTVATNTFTYIVQGDPDTPATGTITAASLVSTGVEVPRPVFTDDAYQALAIKGLQSAQPTGVYYNSTFPLGQIYLWPKPNTAVNQLVLYVRNVFSGFATLTKVYDWPEVPGYGELLEYNLAVRLAAPDSIALRPDVIELARSSLASVKRSNYTLSDLSTDLGLVRDPRYGYNIVSGSGGN